MLMGLKIPYKPLEKQLFLSPALHLARKEDTSNRISLACALALCAIFASTVPPAVNSAFNFISSLEIHSRNEMTALYTKHTGFPCTKQQRGGPKGELFQPEMHLIAYIVDRIRQYKFSKRTHVLSPRRNLLKDIEGNAHFGISSCKELPMSPCP